MKAYIVKDIMDCEGLATVVFAENATQAKKVALTTDVCENAEWTDIRVKRAKALDASYDRFPRSEMYWYDMQDRADMVKYAGFHCLDTDHSECEKCSAKDFCDEYQSYLEEIAEGE